MFNAGKPWLQWLEQFHECFISLLRVYQQDQLPVAPIVSRFHETKGSGCISGLVPIVRSPPEKSQPLLTLQLVSQAIEETTMQPALARHVGCSPNISAKGDQQLFTLLCGQLTCHEDRGPLFLFTSDRNLDLQPWDRNVDPQPCVCVCYPAFKKVGCVMLLHQRH